MNTRPSPIGQRRGHRRHLGRKRDAPQNLPVRCRDAHHLVQGEVEVLLDAADGRRHQRRVRHQVLAWVRRTPDFLAGRLIEGDGQRVAAGGDDDAIAVEQRVLAGVPPGDGRLVFLHEVLLPDQLAGLHVDGMQAAFRIEREDERGADRRHGPRDPVVGAHVDGVAPPPDFFPVSHRQAADGVLLLRLVVVVDVQASGLDGRAGVAFGDRRLPQHLRAAGGPGAVESGFGRDVVAVRPAELRPVRCTDGHGGGGRRRHENNRIQPSQHRDTPPLMLPHSGARQEHSESDFRHASAGDHSRSDCLSNLNSARGKRRIRKRRASRYDSSPIA